MSFLSRSCLLCVLFLPFAPMSRPIPSKSKRCIIPERCWASAFCCLIIPSSIKPIHSSVVAEIPPTKENTRSIAWSGTAFVTIRVWGIHFHRAVFFIWFPRRHLAFGMPVSFMGIKTHMYDFKLMNQSGWSRWTALAESAFMRIERNLNRRGRGPAVSRRQGKRMTRCAVQRDSLLIDAMGKIDTWCWCFKCWC